VSHLLKSNCPVTSQPDWGSVQIHYVGAPIDQERLLKYIIGFREHNEFHEQCVERIFTDILRYCKPQKLACMPLHPTRRAGHQPRRSNFSSASRLRNCATRASKTSSAAAPCRGLSANCYQILQRSRLRPWVVIALWFGNILFLSNNHDGIFLPSSCPSLADDRARLAFRPPAASTLFPTASPLSRFCISSITTMKTTFQPPAPG
jgi:hypothetical protein